MHPFILIAALSLASLLTIHSAANVIRYSAFDTWVRWSLLLFVSSCILAMTCVASLNLLAHSGLLP